MALLNPLDVTYYFKSMDLKSPTIVRLEESDKCLECKTFGNYYSSSFKSSLSKRGSMFTRSCVNRKNRRFQCPTGSFCRRYFLVSIRWCTFCSRMWDNINQIFRNFSWNTILKSMISLIKIYFTNTFLKGPVSLTAESYKFFPQHKEIGLQMTYLYS